MSFLFRYSYVVISILLVAAMIGYAFWAVSGWFGMGAILLAAALLIFWVAARRTVPMPANADKRIRKARGATRALVVHFYSDFHLGSLVKRVLVAGTERAFRGRCEFIYLNMNHPETAPLARSLEAGLGDFVLFDAHGELAERTGIIGQEKLTRLLERPGHRP